MSSAIDLASIAALVGEPARAAMLVALMDGRAHTALDKRGIDELKEFLEEVP